MATAFERLRKVALFDGLSDDDLARICADVQDVTLAPGSVLFREGDPGDRAFVITDGEVEILKATDRREVLLAVRKAGDVIGEMALLEEEPRRATVRARTQTQLVAVPKAALDDLLDTSPAATRAVFGTFLARQRATNDQLKQSERMVQLGTLTAGVAHELNNPAAAVARAAQRLGEQLDVLSRLAAKPTDSTLRAVALALVDPTRTVASDALGRSDAESEVEDWLDDHGVPQPWELAADLVDAGLGVADLERLVTDGGEPAGADALADAVGLLVASTSLRRIAAQIADGATRISSIVRSLKSHAYLDQAPVQDVDVRRGLDDTLTLLGHKVRGIHVVREYDDDLPTITALGTELNQVWTNLIDNACDAMDGLTDRPPTLTVRAHAGDGVVAVEVQDNGPGMPPEVRERVFDAFFTTKPPGQGTGLGLQISHRIVVLEHRGDLVVESEPGRTTFRVTLPIAPPTAAPAPDPRESDVNPTLCDHLEGLTDIPRPEGGCQDCLDMGDTWVHLRYCAECRKVGCCEDSKNRHARAHAAATGHVVIRSREPGETWAWCYEHQVGVETLGP